MKSLLRRAAAGAAVVAVSLGLTSAPAAAENAYTPSDADFATCPAKPAGAQSWTCYVSTVLDGTVDFGSIRVKVDSPLQLVTAQGKLADGTAVAKLGGLTGDPLSIETALPGTPLYIQDLTGTKVKVEATGQVTPGTTMPKEFGLKFRFIHPLLPGKCYVGSDSSPVMFKPVISLALPELRDNILMLRVWTSENTFALPAASGCGLISGGLIDAIVNDRFKLPNNSGDNKASWTWVVRHKTF